MLSTPQLLTLNNEEAEVIVGSNIPYTTSTRLDSSGNPITNFDYRDVGVHLKVKPYINKDGLVYLNIFTEVTTVCRRPRNGRIRSADRADHQQEVHENHRRGERQPDDRHQRHHTGQLPDTGQGIPLLRYIPILGPLFGYSNKSVTRTNLLVFLTPRIVYDAKMLQKISDKLKSQQEQSPDTSRKKIMESLAP